MREGVGDVGAFRSTNWRTSRGRVPLVPSPAMAAFMRVSALPRERLWEERPGPFRPTPDRLPVAGVAGRQALPGEAQLRGVDDATEDRH